jgi:hypothetical protein
VLTDSQATTPFESVWDRPMGRLLGVPHLSSRFRPPLPGLLLFVRVGRPRPRPELVLPRGLRHRQTQTSADTDSELLSLRARWLLFAQRAHPVSKVGGHSYSNRQFRALGYTGVVTNAPTLTFTYALFSETNVWNYHCDGAYPQPQWDCACSAYNSCWQYGRCYSDGWSDNWDVSW